MSMTIFDIENGGFECFYSTEDTSFKEIDNANNSYTTYTRKKAG